MLTIRKRGRTWHIRGTVRVGKETRIVDEHSTGTAERAVAEAYRAKLERETQHELLFGTEARQLTVTFADAALAYLSETRHLSDVSRVRQLEEFFGSDTLAEIDAAAFDRFCREAIPGTSGNTRDRIRITLNSIFRAGGVKAPEIPTYGQSVERIRWLPHDRAWRLVLAYPRHVQPIALVAKDCGLRASENVLMTAGQCDPSWGQHGGFHVKRPKNKRDRVVPWTADVRAWVLPILKGKKDADRLWLNRYGRPYRDTRNEGGNPLTASHRMACRFRAIEDFTWHDWRHHWACWSLVPRERGGFGWSVIELQARGGWEDLESLQKYVAFIEHEGSEDMGTDRAIA